VVSEVKILSCCDCGNPFSFTAEQQSMFDELGFDPPLRCLGCRRTLENARRIINARPAAGVSGATGQLA
jgi:hypothetical protein